MATYVIAAYEVDRCYGGPEEGGWWYNTGELKRVLGVRHNEEEAFALARRLNGWLDKMQRGYKRDIYSMGYAGGRYSIEVYENTAPEYYPATRPHYE